MASNEPGDALEDLGWVAVGLVLAMIVIIVAIVHYFTGG